MYVPNCIKRFKFVDHVIVQVSLDFHKGLQKKISGKGFPFLWKPFKITNISIKATPLYVIFKVNGYYFKHIKSSIKSLKKHSICAHICLPALCIWAINVLYYRALDTLKILEYFFELEILRFFSETRQPFNY